MTQVGWPVTWTLGPQVYFGVGLTGSVSDGQVGFSRPGRILTAGSGPDPAVGASFLQKWHGVAGWAICFLFLD